MPGKGISVTISANDKASAALETLNKRINHITAPVRRVQQQFDRLADSTGIRTVNRELKGAADLSARIAGSIGRAGPALAGIGSAAGLALAMKQASDYGTSLQFAARQAGVGVGTLQRFGNAAEIAGGSFEGAVGGVTELNRNLQLMAHGGQGNPQFMAALSDLHVNLRGANGQLRSSASIMDEVLRKLARMHNAQRQIYFGNAILGSSFQTTLWPAVSQGTAALNSYLDQGRRMVSLAPQQTRALRQSQYEMRRFGQDVTNVTYGALASWAPAVNKDLAAINAWIEKNQKAAESIGKIGTAIVGLGALKPAAWVLRALGLGAVSTAGAAAGSTALLSYATQSTPTESAAADRAPYGGRTMAQRFPGLVVAPSTPTGPVRGTLVPRMPSRAYDVMQQTRAFWKSKGFTDAQVAGILAGGPAAESRFDPGVYGDRGHSYGLYQEHDRRMRGLFAKYGPRPTVAQQDQYAWQELNDPAVTPRGTLNALRHAKTPEQAAFIWTRGFERPRGGVATAELRASDAHLFLPHQQPATAPKGKAELHVRIDGAPPGSRASATTSGDLWTGAPRVTMPLPPGGGPSE